MAGGWLSKPNSVFGFKPKIRNHIFSETPLGNKFSTTWRPVGDYIHLKVLFHVQDTTLQVLGKDREYGDDKDLGEWH